MDLKIKDAVDFVHSYASSITEWKTLKKELLRSLHPTARKLFSTRDTKTKVLNFNSLEIEIVEYWKKLTGVDLYLGKS